jgi:aminoglycoside phosphotransferase (APT) family kinase protein
VADKLNRLLTQFRVPDPSPIARGDESVLFALDGHRVLRVWARRTDETQIAARADLCEAIAKQGLPFEVPEYLEWGTWESLTFSIERRIHGLSLADALVHTRGVGRLTLLANYLQAAHDLSTLRFAAKGFGEVVHPEPTRTTTWQQYLKRRANAALQASFDDLSNDVRHIEQVLVAAKSSIERITEPRPGRLAHGDFTPSNVIVDEHHHVIAVVDWARPCVVGDPLLDAASATTAFDVYHRAEPSDTTFLRNQFAREATPQALATLDAYRIWFALVYSTSRKSDQHRYLWSVGVLRSLVPQSPRGR